MGSSPCHCVELATSDSRDDCDGAPHQLRLKFRHEDAEIERLIDVLLSLASVVNLNEIVNACRDPKDDHVLACALASEADYFVTGDKDPLALKAYQGIQIVTIREFVDAATASQKPLP